MTITIRRARVDDAAAIARLMDDPAVYPGLMQMPYANEESQRARLVESLAPGKADVLLVAERGGEIVGSSGMHPAGASPRRRHVMAVGISVVPIRKGRASAAR
jgi:N-acetylglutamate synthase and related acetyltransferases